LKQRVAAAAERIGHEFEIFPLHMAVEVQLIAPGRD
jgi:hypothetical protein